MDMLMDGLNGIIAIQLLKRIDHKAKIIVCSATSDPSFVAGAAQLGVEAYLNKPIDSEKLRGENTGFSDTIEYEAVSIRAGLVFLSGREHIGSTIVHALDFTSGTAHTAVTPADGDFMRVTGRITVNSGM